MLPVFFCLMPAVVVLASLSSATTLPPILPTPHPMALRMFFAKPFVVFLLLQLKPKLVVFFSMVEKLFRLSLLLKKCATNSQLLAPHSRLTSPHETLQGLRHAPSLVQTSTFVGRPENTTVLTVSQNTTHPPITK
jgi:hypothetical protein